MPEIDPLIILRDRCRELIRCDKRTLSAAKAVTKAEEKYTATRIAKVEARRLMLEAVKQAREADIPWHQIEKETGYSRQYLDRMLREING